MQQALDILQKYWGYSTFRSKQEEIIHSILHGIDTLALLPTGGGKSICFQIPALCLEGICIVVTPLIALMKDQVYQLQKRGIPAQVVYSGMSKKQIDDTLDNMIYGDYKFLYMSPERIQTPLFQERVQRMKVNLIAVDESHCISQWGYDFRPAYLQIQTIKKLLPEVPVLALTASATDEVVKDIQTQLLFQKENVIRKSFFRENISYTVYKEQDKWQRMLKALKKVSGSSIVYVRNRKLTQEIAQYLVKNSITAEAYHAGIDINKRSKIQDLWINNQIKVIVATNAFGMGIDKPDVRLVIHWSPPDTLEEYYQEAGRAGRDEKLAYALLLYNLQDIENITSKKKQYDISPLQLLDYYKMVVNNFGLAYGSGLHETFDIDIAAICNLYNIQTSQLWNAIKILEQNKYWTCNENAYMPPSFKIIITAQDLYTFIIANKNLDFFIKTLLRIYPSIYTQYCQIDYYKLQQIFNKSLHEIKNDFKLLQNKNVIDYNEGKNNLTLTFNRERVHDSHFFIDQPFLEWMSNRHKLRLDATVAYIKNEESCRNKNLLYYFNEKYDSHCGKCDICIKRKINNNSQLFLKSIINKVKNNFPLYFKLEESINILSKNEETHWIAWLREALDEGEIILENNKYKWKK